MAAKIEDSKAYATVCCSHECFVNQARRLQLVCSPFAVVIVVVVVVVVVVSVVLINVAVIPVAIPVVIVVVVIAVVTVIDSQSVVNYELLAAEVRDS